jgi:hypothetical protein
VEGIVIEGTSPTIIIPKDEVVVPDEPQEINVTFNVTKNVAIKEENYEILATVSTSDGKPFQSVGEEQLKVEFIQRVKENEFNLSEGVICKGKIENKKDQLLYCKIKTNDWFERLRSLDSEKYYEELKDVKKENELIYG